MIKRTRTNQAQQTKNYFELGQLEQDIVFGDAATKEVITFLRAHPDASVENKLRLLMIYASVHPDKFEGDKATKIMQLAKLSADDMKAIKNMRLLAGSPNAKKKAAGSFSLTFDGKRKKISVRKDKTNAEEESWALSKFYPMIEDLIESVNKGELSKDDYQFINEPSSNNKERNQSQIKISKNDEICEIKAKEEENHLRI